MQQRSKLIEILIFTGALLAASLLTNGCTAATGSGKKTHQDVQADVSGPEDEKQTLEPTVIEIKMVKRVKKNLSEDDVQTRFSRPVAFQPVPADKKVLYVDLRDMSRKHLNVMEPFRKALASKGYRVTKDPREATYMFQGNILEVGKSGSSAAKSALDAGFGGATNAVKGGDAVYVMIADLQIRERPLDGKGGWKFHRTRMVSTTDKSGLEFEKSRAVIQTALARSMSDIF